MGVYFRQDVEIPYLCFTANTTGSTIKLNKTWSPTAVTLETSTDWSSWTTYTFGSTITLSNIWDKVYWRNTSETDTRFSTSVSDYYQFSMTWSVAWSGEVTTLLNKYNTDTLSDYCFFQLFNACSSLTSAPDLFSKILPQRCYDKMFQNCYNMTTPPIISATTIWNYSCNLMFIYCSWLTKISKIEATSIWTGWCQQMFLGCTSLKLSTSKGWNYQNEYIIPALSVWTNWLNGMFTSTWGSFTWTPTAKTTYYTSNEVI